jgi:hypothetical protein
MKRLTIALLIVALLVVFSPSLSGLAQPALVPHENPATAEESPDPALLLLFYGNLFDRAAISQYQDAESMLNELEYANIPPELGYVINRYNEICRELFTTLDNLELLLDEASSLLGDYQIGEAKQKIDEAGLAIDKARLLMEDIEEAAAILGEKLGVFAASAGSPIAGAYERLEGMLLRLRQLIDELDRLRLSLIERHRSQSREELMPTELSLGVTPASVFIGDVIPVSGRLTGGGIPLADRRLALLLDDKPMTITTDLDGRYTTSITIPYNYVLTMTLQAFYAPYGIDIGTYLASRSLPVPVSTSFYATTLTASVPESVPPGLPVTISGEVSSTGDSIDRSVRVFLDNNQVAQETVRGQFLIEITPPPRLPDGEYALTLEVASRGRYAGTSKDLMVNISRIPVQVDIQAPSRVVVPNPFDIKGKVYYGQETLQDAEVRLSFGQSTVTTRTLTDGSFTATIDTAIDLSLAAPRELTITVRPVEPWYASCQVRRWIFSINPTSIGVMLIIFLSLGLLVYNRVRASSPGPREEMVYPEAELRKRPAVTPPSKPEYRFTGIKGSILSAYLSGLETVEKAAGIYMAPHVTLREFLNTTIPRLPVAARPFTELTQMAEMALYSAREPSGDMAARAEQLAATIKGELKNGTA